MLQVLHHFDVLWRRAAEKEEAEREKRRQKEAQGNNNVDDVNSFEKFNNPYASLLTKEKTA